jgi:PTS system N-acetylglucosamine-specific IIC component
MFLAPVLYAVHAVLTGVAMAVMNALDIKLGFTFSAGLFDYVLNFGKATHPLWLVPLGAGLCRGLLRPVPLLHPQVRPQDPRAARPTTS